MKHFPLFTSLVSAVFLLSACGSSAPTQTAEPTPAIAAPSATAPTTPVPSVGPLATLHGRIGYQAPPSPASMLYAVDAQAQRWYSASLDQVDADGLLPFTLEVPTGNYILYAHPTTGSPEVAGYVKDLNAGELLTLSVTAGQTVDNLLLQGVAPHSPCQIVSIPASPDGRFPAVPNTCAGIPSDEIDSSQWYVLSTKALGPTQVLEVFPGMDNALGLNKFATDHPGQDWHLVSDGNGFYFLYNRLVTTFILGTLPVAGGKYLPVMVDDHPEGPRWKFTRQDDGYYRITESAIVNVFSLDVEKGGDMLPNLLVLAPDGDSSGQLWNLSPMETIK